MEKKKYNLHSQKSDTSQVQFDLHMSDDNDFVTNLLGQKQTMSHQDSDSSVSDSDIDCGQIMQDSDSDGAGPSGHSTGYMLKNPTSLPMTLAFKRHKP